MPKNARHYNRFARQLSKANDSTPLLLLFGEKRATAHSSCKFMSDFFGRDNENNTSGQKLAEFRGISTLWFCLLAGARKTANHKVDHFKTCKVYVLKYFTLWFAVFSAPANKQNHKVGILWSSTSFWPDVLFFIVPANNIEHKLTILLSCRPYCFTKHQKWYTVVRLFA